MRFCSAAHLHAYRQRLTEDTRAKIWHLAPGAGADDCGLPDDQAQTAAAEVAPPGECELGMIGTAHRQPSGARMTQYRSPDLPRKLSGAQT